MGGIAPEGHDPGLARGLAHLVRQLLRRAPPGQGVLAPAALQLDEGGLALGPPPLHPRDRSPLLVLQPVTLPPGLMPLAAGLLELRQVEALALRDQVVAVVRRHAQVAEDVLDQAGPQIALDVLPRVELDLDDRFVERQLVLRPAPRGGVVDERVNPPLQALQKEALAGPPATEQPDRQRGVQRP